MMETFSNPHGPYYQTIIFSKRTGGVFICRLVIKSIFLVNTLPVRLEKIIV